MRCELGRRHDAIEDLWATVEWGVGQMLRAARVQYG